MLVNGHLQGCILVLELRYGSLELGRDHLDLLSGHSKVALLLSCKSHLEDLVVLAHELDDPGVSVNDLLLVHRDLSRAVLLCFLYLLKALLLQITHDAVNSGLG